MTQGIGGEILQYLFEAVRIAVDSLGARRALTRQGDVTRLHLSFVPHRNTIEQRIAWLDFQLSSTPDGDLSEEQSRRLWRERVELMDSLVKVRYAEAGSLWF